MSLFKFFKDKKNILKEYEERLEEFLGKEKINEDEKKKIKEILNNIDNLLKDERIESLLNSIEYELNNKEIKKFEHFKKLLQLLYESEENLFIRLIELLKKIKFLLIFNEKFVEKKKKEVRDCILLLKKSNFNEDELLKITTFIDEFLKEKGKQKKEFKEKNQKIEKILKEKVKDPSLLKFYEQHPKIFLRTLRSILEEQIKLDEELNNFIIKNFHLVSEIDDLLKKEIKEINDLNYILGNKENDEDFIKQLILFFNFQKKEFEKINDKEKVKKIEKIISLLKNKKKEISKTENVIGG